MLAAWPCAAACCEADRGSLCAPLHYLSLQMRSEWGEQSGRKHFTLVESAHGGGAIANAQLTPSEVLAPVPTTGTCSYTA